MTEKPWLQSYPAGIPATIDPDAYSSLVHAFDHFCQQYSTNTALLNFGTSMTYQEWHQQAERFAAFLQQELQLKKGDRFAIMLPNIIQFPIALFGALKAGLIVVNVNPLYTKPELIHELSDAQVSAVIVLDQFVDELQKSLPFIPSIQRVIITQLGDCLGKFKGRLFDFAVRYVKHLVPKIKISNPIIFSEAMLRATHYEYQPIALNPDDIAFLQYTGGTTGLAKGAVLTHRNLLANIMQCLSWVRSDLVEGQETILTALPLYHTFSLTVCCFAFMALGARCLLITNPRDLNGFVRSLIRCPVSVFVGLNTLFNSLMHHSRFKKIDFSGLKLVIAGGMAMQKGVADHWQALTGKPIIEGYGLTEASPIVSINPLTLTSYNGSIGLPIPSTEVQLAEDGELWVRGPQVMQCYWNQPEETANVLTKEGWLKTGDIVRMDEKGFLYLMDRKKDMIIVSGFNVYPNEVESVMAECPGVREVAVVGVPSENSGEKVKAFVVRDNPHLTEAMIMDYCHTRLTPYKLPKSIEFRDELPKSNVGKILRRALR